MAEIIGRKKEIGLLNDLYNSKKAEFVAIYGRRRVGKTFLIDSALEVRLLSVMQVYLPLSKKMR